jgi:hypothetical protein
MSLLRVATPEEGIKFAVGEIYNVDSARQFKRLESKEALAEILKTARPGDTLKKFIASSFGNFDQMIMRVVTDALGVRASSDTIDFLNMFLKYDWRKRISARDALRHNYVACRYHISCSRRSSIYDKNGGNLIILRPYQLISNLAFADTFANIPRVQNGRSKVRHFHLLVSIEPVLMIANAS